MSQHVTHIRPSTKNVNGSAKMIDRQLSQEKRNMTVQTEPLTETGWWGPSGRAPALQNLAENSMRGEHSGRALGSQTFARQVCQT
jgi:hypothetical protein